MCDRRLNEDLIPLINSTNVNNAYKLAQEHAGGGYYW